MSETETARPDLDAIEAQANEYINGTSERGDYFTALDVTLPLTDYCRRLEQERNEAREWIRNNEDYRAAATAEAERVDELQKENEALQRDVDTFFASLMDETRRGNDTAEMLVDMVAAAREARQRADRAEQEWHTLSMGYSCRVLRLLRDIARLKEDREYFLSNFLRHVEAAADEVAGCPCNAPGVTADAPLAVSAADMSPGVHLKDWRATE